MIFIPDIKKDPGPRKNKKDKNSPDTGQNAAIKPKNEDHASDDGEQAEDTDMAQYQNIDSGKDTSDTERSDNDIEGPDNGAENIFK